MHITCNDGALVGEIHPETVEAETKENTPNNFTRPLQYDTLVTDEQLTNVSYHDSHTNLSNFGDTCAKLWISYYYEKLYGRRH